MHPRNFLSMIFLAVLLAPIAFAQEKGGQEEFGPYELVENWPQPLAGPENEAWTWGETSGVFAETRTESGFRSAVSCRCRKMRSLATRWACTWEPPPA